jgi:tetratricopeptide (TPR) repeat protein
MHAATSFRLRFLAAGLFALAGCSGPTVATTPAKLQPPRRIELPAHLRPLEAAQASPDELPVVDESPNSRPIPVQYEQPRASAGPSVDLAANAVREPIGPPTMQTASAMPTAAPVRSAFVPIVVPPVTAAPQASALPPLAASPAFVQTAAPREGPALSPPVQQMTAPPTAASFSGAASQQQPTAAGPIGFQAGPGAAGIVASPPVGFSPPHSPTTASPMDIVCQRAMQMADQATTIAQRGMFHSAKADLLQALQLIAQAQDVQEGGTRHALALAAGLTALEESRDFAANNNRPSDAVDIASIAANHRTPVLKVGAQVSVSPIVAQQRYFAFAQEQLLIAAGGMTASSQVLYRLGRLQTALSAHDADPLAAHGPQAIVYHQAALASDAGNWLAANELGVLYARYGQLPQARQLLLHSLRLHPHVQGWQNLSAVHRQLGETDLAKLAENERQLLAQKSGEIAAAAGDMVRWVDPKTFAAAGGHDAQTPETRFAASGSNSTPRR